MKLAKGFLTAALTLIFCIFCSSSVMAASFSDISGHWAENYIEKAVDKGFVTGYPDGTFHPNSYITRAEMAAIFSRMLKLQNASPNNFTDMPGNWYNEFVLKGVYAGFLGGYPDHTFRPENNITRQETAKMMGTCLPNNATGAGISNFSDRDQIGSWAADSVALCANKGYFVGYESQRFGPNGNLTRAEAATILVRMSNGENIVPETNITGITSSAIDVSAAATNLSNQIRSNGITTGGNASLTLNGISLLGESTIDGDINFTTTKVVRMNLSGNIVMSHTVVGSANIRGIIQCSNSNFGTLAVGGTSSFQMQNSAVTSMEINAPTTIIGNGSSIQNVQQNVKDFTSNVPIGHKNTDIPAETNAVTIKMSYNGGSEKVVTLAYGADDSLLSFLYTVACDPNNSSLLNSKFITPFNDNLSDVEDLKVNGLALWSDAGWNEAIDLFDGTSASEEQLNRMKPDFNAASISLSDLQDFIGGLNRLYNGELSDAVRSRLVSNLNAMDLTTTTASGATVTCTLICKTGMITDNKAIAAYFINHILWTGDTVDQFFAKCGNTITLQMESSSGKVAQFTIQKTTV